MKGYYVQPEDIVVYVEVGQVFPDLEPDYQTFTSLLSSLSLTDTLFRCAQVNLILSGLSDDNRLRRQAAAIGACFSETEITAIQEVAKEHGGAKRIAAFSRGTMLELMRWATLLCSDLPNDGRTYDDAAMRQAFAAAALIANDVWGRRVFTDRVVPGEPIETTRRKGLPAFRQVYEVTRGPSHALHWLGRGWCLFQDYYPKQQPMFYEEFEAKAGMPFYAYYTCLCSVAAAFLDPSKSNGMFDAQALGAGTPLETEFRKFLDLAAQTPRELRNALWHDPAAPPRDFHDAPSYNYRPLRDRPVLRTEDERAIVMDPVLFADKVAMGPLFVIARGENRANSNRVFEAFGLAFEEYVCDILKRMFNPESDVLAQRLSCPTELVEPSGTQLQIDACLNDVTQAVLFEIKAVFISEDRVLEQDPQAYMEALRDKYVVSCRDGGKPRPKGVAQLARAVTALAHDGAGRRNTPFEDLKRVYPVLLVRDELLGTPLHGAFLASEFSKCLDPDERVRPWLLRKGRLLVDSLIVLTIGNIEDMETSIEDFAFRDLLSGYSKADPNRRGCLRDYLASEPKYGGQVLANKRLMEKLSEVAGMTGAVLFPGRDDSSRTDT